MNSRHRHITTGRSVTAFGNDVFIALTFVVLLLCSANAQQQPVNVPSASPPKTTDNDSARILESAPELASALRTLASQTRADAVPLDRKPYAALVIGSGVDLATSLHALAHTPGAHESNPLLAQGGTWGLVAGKVATTAGLVWAMQRFAKGGHPTLAKVIGWTGGIALSGVALHNARTR